VHVWYIEVRPNIREIQDVWKMSALAVGLCCVGFIKPNDDVAGVRRQRLVLSIGPNLITNKESSLWKVVFWTQDRTTDNIQNCDIYINISSSQTCRPCQCLTKARHRIITAMKFMHLLLIQFQLIIVLKNYEGASRTLVLNHSWCFPVILVLVYMYRSHFKVL
jgi:hypothetical protein